MQYTYTFSHQNGHRYTVVASRYEQAKRAFYKVMTGFLTVTYNGRYYGPTVKNGKIVNIK